MTANNMTVKEHFVPKTYLRGFSCDGTNVFAYRMSDGFRPPCAVKVDSICYEKNLYEVRDENDNIILQNQVENQLSNIEGGFSSYRKLLERKAFIKSNFQSAHILTAEEKTFWKYYIAFQMLRVPLVLDKAEAIIENEFPIKLKKNVARVFALDSCLSSPTKNSIVTTSSLNEYCNAFEKMTIVVGVDDSDSIITSDDPVYAYSPTQSHDNAEEIIFPLTSKLVIYLFGGQMKSQVRKNSLLHIDAPELKRIQNNIAYSANEWIYSKRPLSKEEKQTVDEAHADRLQDMNNQGSKE